MTNAQRPNKHQRTKSNHRTTTKGARGSRSSIFKHGKGKGKIKVITKKRK